MNETSRYIVGIDLGTTNSAVSYIDTEAASPALKQFSVPQLVEVGEVGADALLPSFCYLPGAHELPEGALELPWTKENQHAVGIFAREQGAAVPGRLVASAKSWLAHGGVDRTSGILPWQGDLGDDAVSPVEISRYYIEHIGRAWDAKFGNQRDREGNRCILSQQHVIITVPASFDEAARELTRQAAADAGLTEITFLEEPLAAFYAWLHRNKGKWQQQLDEKSLVLVVDIGGGTTDFSLIDVEAGYTLRRTAVGDHLLLGGDNVDMALARQVEDEWGVKLKSREWSTLCHQCRAAKERLLAPQAPEQVQVSVAAPGSSIVGGTRTGTITHAQVLTTLLEGFFPRLDADAHAPKKRTGIRQMGLPYVADPAATRHLLDFLRHAAGLTDADSQNGLAMPHRVLFNGGSLQPELLRTRLSEILRDWTGREVPELVSEDLNLAVSRGAVCYGLARRGKGVRVKGGIARSYYLEVARGKNDKTLLCVMPRDTEEGQRIELTGYDFRVIANRPVQFPLFTSATRLGDQAGDVILDREELTQMPPLQTVLSYGKGEHLELDIRLHAILNEVGTLDIWCETTDGHHRYPLSFNIRRAPREGQSMNSLEKIIDAQLTDTAREVLVKDFDDADRLPSIYKDIENTVDLGRREWGAHFLRLLTDELITMKDVRERTAVHESRWLNLAGFCLRPGFGAAGDEWRTREMWKIWHTGPLAKSKPDVATEWWIFWRRIAGGLGEGHQQQISGQLAKELVVKGIIQKTPKGRNKQEAVEMWRCLGGLERMSAKQKLKVFRAILEHEGKLDSHFFWTLARLGARQLFYGPENAVIPADRLSTLLGKLFDHVKKANKQALRMGLLAVSNICRRTGMRDLDFEDNTIQQALYLLQELDAPDEWKAQLEDITEDSDAYRTELIADRLPLGLVAK